MISKFQYEPFVRELKQSLSHLIIAHFQLCYKKEVDFNDFYLIPVSLEKKRLKWHGFNQSEEIAKELSKFLKIPLINDVLYKTKVTPHQMELLEKERKENIKGAFSVKNKEIVSEKRVLLVDDVYTTGSTMQECTRVLKDAGAREVWGVTVARE